MNETKNKRRNHMIKGTMSPDVLPGQPCPALGLDEACIELNSHLPYKIDLWKQVEECYMCDATHWTAIKPYQDVSLLINTSYPLYFYYTDDAGSRYCNTSFPFEEHGIYGWNITQDMCSDVWTIWKPKVSFYAPLIIALAVMTVTAVLIAITRCVVQREWTARICLRSGPFSELEDLRNSTAKACELVIQKVKKASLNELHAPKLRPSTARLRTLSEKKSSNLVDLGVPQSRETSPGSQSSRSPRRQSARVKSLDTFRGIALVLMVFVNYGGGGYRLFKHKSWNGMTFADVVFPWFLWVMGMSLVLSLQSQLRSDRSRRSVWRMVLRRSFALIVMGVLLNSFGHGLNDVSKLRFPGVLQRLGMSYLIVASIETAFINMETNFEYGLLLDLWDGRVQWMFALALSGIWTLVTFVAEVPDCIQGYIGPGGLHDHGHHKNCTGGVAGYIDRSILGPSHIYQNPTCRPVYHNKMPYDPEGILGTLTAAVLVHLGAHASRVLLCYRYDGSRIGRWIFWGVCTGLTGGMLCGFAKENGLIPINKNLFSLSFVLVTGGLAYIFMAMLYILIDTKHWWSGAPFNFIGMNSIIVFVGHEITKKMFPWSWKVVKASHKELLAMNLIGTSLWIIICYILYRNRIFITV